MKRTCAVFVVAALAAAAQGALLFSDNFDALSAGGLNGQGGWAAFSAAGTNPVQLVGAGDLEARLVQGLSSAEDVEHMLPAAMAAGDKWYAGFDVNVTGGVSLNDYFTAFRQDLGGGVSGFPTKIGTTTSTTSDFTFYVHQGGGSGPTAGQTVEWPTGFSYGGWHRLVFSYEYSTGLGELWIDPVLALGEAGNPSINVTNIASATFEADRIMFRQGNRAGGTQLVDGVRAATTWREAVPEPASLALLAVGFLAGLRRR